MTITLVSTAIFDLTIAAIHLGFWKLFHWQSQLEKLHFINKGAMQVMNVALITFFSMIAYLLLSFPDEVLTTNLGRALLGGVAIMWGIRTLGQVVFFPKESKLSWALFVVCLGGTFLHTMPLLAA